MIGRSSPGFVGSLAAYWAAIERFAADGMTPLEGACTTVAGEKVRNDLHEF